MKMRARFVAPALLATAAIPTIVLAQAQPPAEAQSRSERQAQRPQLSPEARARLQEGRFAMIRETLKLNDAQRKLWEPVEAQLRASMAERQKLREERQLARKQAQEQGRAAASLPERLDRASERMARRAAQMKAFAEVFKPFYASLDDEQKAVAGIVLRQVRGHGGHGHRWAMQR